MLAMHYKTATVLYSTWPSVLLYNQLFTNTHDVQYCILIIKYSVQYTILYVHHCPRYRVTQNYSSRTTVAWSFCIDTYFFSMSKAQFVVLTVKGDMNTINSTEIFNF